MKIYLQNLGRVLSGLRKKARKNSEPGYELNIEKKYKEYFLSIDELPLYNWIKCTNGDKTFVRREKNGTEEADLIVWEMIYNQYLKQYGLNKTYKRYMDQLKKLAFAELDFIITGNNFKLTIAEMEKQRLEGMLNNANYGISIEQTLIHLSKWIGYLIKTKEITVLEYFNLLHEYERSNKLEHGKKN